MRIWRDIPTQPALQAMLSPEAAQDGGVATLLAVVSQYHALQKDLEGNLLLRRQALLDIAARVERRLNPARQAVNTVFDFATRGQTRRLEGTDAEALRRLTHRARAKAQYLAVLTEYYANNQGELADPGSLWNQLTIPRERQGHLLGLLPGARLERIDPLHRDFELGGPEDASWLTAGGGSASIEVMTWFKLVQNGGTTAPLWLHLETTDFCLDTGTAKTIGVVPYLDPRQPQAGVFAVKFNNAKSRLVQAEMGGWTQQWNWAPFDTQWADKSLSGKAGLNHALAYVWTPSGDLFASLHNPTQAANMPWREFHHSSFTSGGMVRGAGMIAGAGGLVTYLSNDSGHYQPDALHMRQLVARLDKRGVFTPDAVIHNATNHTDTSVRQFLTADLRPAPPRPGTPAPALPAG